MADNVTLETTNRVGTCRICGKPIARGEQVYVIRPGCSTYNFPSYLGFHPKCLIEGINGADSNAS